MVLLAETYQWKVKINNLFSNNQINNREKENLHRLKWLVTRKFKRRNNKRKDKLRILGKKMKKNRIVKSTKIKIKELVNAVTLNPM